MADTNARPARRWQAWAAVAAIVLVLLAALNRRAEMVGAEEHGDYTQLLRDLGELDARINTELLANRLDLTRNYDALTQLSNEAQTSSARAGKVPGYLSAAERQRVADAAAALATGIAEKTAAVDAFRRSHSVLRNSQTYFLVAGSSLLDADLARPLEAATRHGIDRYVRSVLAYARAPDAAAADALDEAARRLDRVQATGAHRVAIGSLRRHGDVIRQRLAEVDRLTAEIVDMPTSALLEALNRDYAHGHGHALDQANAYRVVLYALVAMLTVFLGIVFLRLARARHSLEIAHREVSARYAAQLAAEKLLTLHATAFRSAHDGITLTDAEGNIVDVNPAFTRITGWAREEVIGRNPRILRSGRQDDAFYTEMWKSIRETGSWRGEIWNRNKDGDVYPELLSISAVRDEAGTLTNYVAVFADIGRIKAQERQLTQLAYYDSLTELPNRTLLADRLELAIAQTRRAKTLMAVCYLDLDGFKPINDTWGHEAGDRVLVEISQRLSGALRGGDTVARLGGDEFALLLLGLNSRDEHDDAIKRLLDRIAVPLTCLPEPCSVSASIGVTLFPDDDSDADALVRHADQAMYQAKQAGKNNYHLFDPELDRSARTRYDRVARVRQALEDREFVLYYQPKVAMRSGKVIGAEALIRWNHPERGIVPPSEFLPLIEDDDLIKLVGDWVIEAAMAQLAQWHAEGLDVTVSVNVAGRQLQAPEFVEKLKVALFLHPEVADRLELEVLETAALEDVVKTSRVIDECRNLGVSFSLDDFGTGYSSLTYLKRLPAETIKIDQSFVRDILSDHNNLVIVQGVIGLAKAFERNILAEGVETVEHGRLLMQLNCDLAQGYGIAKPMPADQFARWAREWRPHATWESIRHCHWLEADYPLFIAEIEHRAWVAQLVHAIEEGLPVPPQQLVDDLSCRFSQWLGSAGRTPRYARMPAFAGIEAPHRDVHEIARRIDHLWRDGAVDAARAELAKLITARDAVIAALHAMQMSVAVTRPAD